MPRRVNWGGKCPALTVSSCWPSGKPFEGIKPFAPVIRSLTAAEREILGIRRSVLLSGTSTRSAPAGRRPPKPSRQVHSFMKKVTLLQRRVPTTELPWCGETCMPMRCGKHYGCQGTRARCVGYKPTNTNPCPRVGYPALGAGHARNQGGFVHKFSTRIAPDSASCSSSICGCH